MVKTITEAVGDLNINSADAAAAIHAKCLICDKPITASGAVRARTAAAGLNKNRGGVAVSSSMPLLGYSKALDDSSVNSGGQDATMFNRLTSNNPAVAQSERVKVATELAIMRSSIEPLPEINVSTCSFTACCGCCYVLLKAAKVLCNTSLLKKNYVQLLICIFVSTQDSLSNNNNEHMQHQQGAHYKQRIRHSAGGGVGPNYKKDTR